jgi:hypothetical protein
MLDEFILNEARNNPTSWVNKFAMQAGAKYIDAFGINNLDIQVETNRVRPFTYSHKDTIGNYTHYNQPLAHPLGANFQEFIGIINYQPAPKWQLYARAVYYKQGLDSSGINFGGNIFRNYQTRTSNNGFEVGNGRQANVLNAFAQVSYELRENLLFEISVLYRNAELAGVAKKQNTKMISAGMRLNMFRRNYDF